MKKLHVLLEIFTIFGSPVNLQSDSGQKFTNKIVDKLSSIWEELEIVYGKPHHSQSQGSVKRASQDIENISNETTN